MPDTLLSQEALPEPASPPTTQDFAFFWEGLQNRKLLVQQCIECHGLRHPPATMCPTCNSLEWQAMESSGAGHVYSYTVHHYPALAGIVTPHAVVLADMQEGFRLVGALRNEDLGRLAIDAPVQVEFLPASSTHASFNFKLGDPGQSEEPVR